MGGPKALIRDPAGVAWVVRTTRLLSAAGCSPVVVVIGAAAEQVAAELANEPAEVVEAPDWEQGMAASLRTGLTALLQPATPELVAALIVPVDVPGLTADVVRRISAHSEQKVLARAVYHGNPGHPVLIGRDHWGGVIASAAGDEGARAYLKQHQAAEIECSDLSDGTDVDMVGQLPDGHHFD
jgi:nicotine blue oxidoreductase